MADKPQSYEERVAAVVEAAHERGLDVMATTVNGELRVFVDAASAVYKQKRTTILPSRYKKVGMEYLGVWKMKPITGDALKAAQAKVAKGDKVARIRLVKKGTRFFWKTGKLVTLPLGRYQMYIMRLRREAGWTPLHHHPHTRPGTARALKQNAAQGYKPNKKLYEDRGAKK
jgi:hypothetical protein